MHILVALTVVLALWSTEMTTGSVAPSVNQSLMITFGGIALLAWLSGFLSWVSSRCSWIQTNSKPDSARHRKFEQMFVASWLVIIVAIFGFARWGNVIRENWNLDRYFLLDEMLLVLPILFPLVVHWWIQSRFAESSDSIKNRQSFRSRLGYVGLRMQVYFALSLVPMVILWAACDISRLFEIDSIPQLKWAMLLGAFAIATLFFPWFLILVWPNQKLTDQTLLKRIQQICDEKKLKISDVRVWKTGNRVTNAMVAGFFWPCRTLWLSDGLINMLTPDELDTIVRHETGHVRRQHLVLRLAVLLLPIAFAAIFLWLLPHQTQTWISRLGNIGIEASWIAWVLIPSLGLCYLTWALNWISHQIEKDADIEACVLAGQGTDGGRPSLDHQRVSNFKSALQKIAAQMPGGVRKRTFLHPSILDRATFLSELSEHPEKLRDFRKQLAHNLFLLALVAVAVGMAFALI